MPDRATVLVVEDEAIVALDIRQRLEKMGFAVSATVATGRAAVEQVRTRPPALILMDIQIKGDWDGIDTACEIAKISNTPIIFLTANSDRATIERAKASGPLAYLLKPFEDRELQTTIEIALERHRLERELKASEQWLMTTLRSIGDAIIACDAQGLVTYLNPMAAKLSGWTLEEAKGRPARDILRLALNRSGHCELVDPLAEVVKSGNTINLLESALTCKDGTQITVEDSAAPIRLETGELIGAVIVFRDVTARLFTEKRLREAERRVQNLVETINEGIGEVDSRAVITFCNPAFARILGQASPETVKGQSLLSFFDPQSAERIAAETEQQERGKSSRYDLSITLPSGDERNVQITSTPVYDERGVYTGTVGAMVDITERKILEAEIQKHRHHLEELVAARTEELKRANDQLVAEYAQREKAEGERRELEAHLAKARKMEALGLLAGGVAHDLNNTLGPLVGYPELLLAKLPDDSPLRKMVEKIGHSAQDAASVIQDLLTMARRGRYEMQPVSLGDIVRDFLESPAYMRFVGEKPTVRVEHELQERLPNILGSSAHLSKVVMNLVSNAYDAITETGSVKIRCYSQRIEGLESGFNKIPGGEYVILRVADTGCGIARDDLAKIFEPYYSKKEIGRSGTGLGLAVVYGIVEDHGGYYDVFSEVGRGTEFVFYFPVTVQAAAKGEHAGFVGGSESLLVVDDNEDQRDLAYDVLGSLGYNVSVASNGRAAVAYLKDHWCDLVLLDMIMEPDFDGLDTFRAIRELRPTQKAIVLSGFAQSGRVDEILRMGASAYLRKPYTVEAIARLVRSALDPAPKRTTDRSREGQAQSTMT